MRYAPPVQSKHAHPWTKATLGRHAARGDPILLWCNDPACSYRLEHGKPYRAVLTAADLAAYAEKYGEAVTFEDFRARLRLPALRERRCQHDRRCPPRDARAALGARSSRAGDLVRRRGPMAASSSRTRQNRDSDHDHRHEDLHR
jgi:hypothetical protein